MGRNGILDYLRSLWMEHGFKVRFSVPFSWTGYTKPMTFLRPVPPDVRISSLYGEKGPYWSWHINAGGLWVPGQLDGVGQHKGIDFACRVGTEVKAMCDGFVVRSGWENVDNPRQGFGLRIRQQLDLPGMEGWQLVYGHLSAAVWREGNVVKQGDRIAYSGDTGHITGPHLHVELVDPRGQYHPITWEEPAGA